MTNTCSTTTASPNSGEVAEGYWQTLCQVLRALGLTPEAGKASDVEPSKVTVPQYLEAFSVGLAHHENFGIQLGSAVSLKTFPVLGMTLLSCSNLRQGLEQILRYESLSHDLGHSELVVETTQSRFVWTANPIFVPDPQIDLAHALALSVFAGIKSFAPNLVRREIPFKKVHFVSSDSRSAKSIQTFFNCPVYFNQPENALVVQTDVLDWEVSDGDPSTFEALTSYGDNLLSQGSQEHDFVRKVQSILPTALRRQAFRIEDIAQSLNVTPRTLQRKLKELNHSYQILLDETRKQLAEYHLQENKLTIGEIAFVVGYQEQSSFNHAFKSWTGKSPREYRVEKQRDS